MEPSPLLCPDGGVCHHQCYDEGPCWRVSNCGPLSNKYVGDQWPDAVKKDPKPIVIRPGVNSKYRAD